MKSLFFAASLFVSQLLWAQFSVYNNKSRPLYIIDSSIAGTFIGPNNLDINPNEIERLEVDKNYFDSAKNIRGKIYITMKNPKTYNFLSLSNILKQYGIKPGDPYVYIINNNFLTDTAYFRIDSSQILSVKEETHQFEYLQKLNRELCIVHIKTKTKENLEEQQRDIEESKKIRMRGDLSFH